MNARGSVGEWLRRLADRIDKPCGEWWVVSADKTVDVFAPCRGVGICVSGSDYTVVHIADGEDDFDWENPGPGWWEFKDGVLTKDEA